MITKNNKDIKILIIGAGEAGALVAKNINKGKGSSFKVVGFLDDNLEKVGSKIEGVKVLGSIKDIKKIAEKENIKEVIIAIPSERGASIRRIVEVSSGLGLVYKILPRRSEVLLQKFDKDYLRYIRRVEAEDLLGGEIVKKDQSTVKKYTKGKTILVTGAAGSIGAELSKQITAYRAKKVIFYDWWEYGMFELQNYIEENYPEVNCEFVIGDIKDKVRLDTVLSSCKPDTVFHAAAYKHVPLMEHNPSEAIKNNIFGTKTVAELSVKHKVKKFVLISTDKAVNPTNIMGATKRAAEKVIHILAGSQKDTKFFSVRFGNVINSHGSAIPVFEKQIELGGPVTVTHKEVTRFFMTIPEAVHLILQAWVMGENNDLFVLDMGEPTKIVDLAKLLITVHGYVPEKDVKIKFIGLRPGEKLYEEVLVNKERADSTKYEKIFRTKNYLKFAEDVFSNNLKKLEKDIVDRHLEKLEVSRLLKKMISTYRPSSGKNRSEF